jgi:hypothetical protein
MLGPFRPVFWFALLLSACSAPQGSWSIPKAPPPPPAVLAPSAVIAEALPPASRASVELTEKDPAAIASVDPREEALRALSSIGPRHPDPFCEPAISPELAEVLFQTAQVLIRAHGDHVSVGELQVLLPLLRLAAHSGHRGAQARYGRYVVGYYLTDEMFWPRQPDVAADALAMLRIVSKDEPTIFGEAEAALYLRGMLPGDPEERVPRPWLKKAEEIEREYRRCQSLALPRTSPRATGADVRDIPKGSESGTGG